jgi:hypothetical protein
MRAANANPGPSDASTAPVPSVLTPSLDDVALQIPDDVRTFIKPANLVAGINPQARHRAAPAAANQLSISCWIVQGIPEFHVDARRLQKAPDAITERVLCKPGFTQGTKRE